MFSIEEANAVPYVLDSDSYLYTQRMVWDILNVCCFFLYRTGPVWVRFEHSQPA